MWAAPAYPIELATSWVHNKGAFTDWTGTGVWERLNPSDPAPQAPAFGLGGDDDLVHRAQQTPKIEGAY